MGLYDFISLHVFWDQLNQHCSQKPCNHCNTGAGQWSLAQTAGLGTECGCKCFLEVGAEFRIAVLDLGTVSPLISANNLG